MKIIKTNEYIKKAQVDMPEKAGRRPPYMQKMEEELKEKKARVKELAEAIRDIQTYLSSEKFYKDPYVNKDDIFRMLPHVYDLDFEYSKIPESHFERKI